VPAPPGYGRSAGEGRGREAEAAEAEAAEVDGRRGRGRGTDEDDVGRVRYQRPTRTTSTESDSETDEEAVDESDSETDEEAVEAAAPDPGWPGGGRRLPSRSATFKVAAIILICAFVAPADTCCGTNVTPPSDSSRRELCRGARQGVINMTLDFNRAKEECSGA